MLVILAWISLMVALASALVIVVDEWRHPQTMWVMNIVWPITALYFSVFAVWAYFRLGRGLSRDATRGLSRKAVEEQAQARERQARRDPTWQQTAISDSHCGAGCTLGDIISEFSVAGLGLTLLGVPLYAEFAWDLTLAWLFGIAFQYFTIKPMRHLSPLQGLIAAVKADTLSILTFEIGLFSWMALTYFVFFPHPHLKPSEPVFWLMMQIGMIIGYFTSFPMNRLLLKWGTKEAMG